MTEKFCGYCQKFRDSAGFKTIFHASSNSKRGMCCACQDIRKKPRAELLALAESKKSERKKK